MKRAASNLALPAFDHARHLPRLAARGIAGLEVAPFHTWDVAGEGVTAAQVRDYRRMAELAGMRIIGLHDLTEAPLEVEKFTISAYKAKIMAGLVDLSTICRDLGGRTLILGRRRRGRLDERAAWIALRGFLEELLPQIEHHGTVLCLAPIGPADGDFCMTARQCTMFANAVDHGSFGLHLDTSGLSAEGKVAHAIFAAARGRLELFHIDEPGRAPIGSTGTVDHEDFRRHLLASTYPGWVSVVQGAGDAEARLAALDPALDFVDRAYFSTDLEEERSRRVPRPSVQHDLQHHR